MMNENEDTLRGDVISNICWKAQLPQQDVIKENFYLNYLIQKRI